MLSLIKKIFGKAAPKASIPESTAVPQAPSTPMPTIEVAHLSLSAITARFPDELKPLLTSEPSETAAVTLPMPTILKQLPAGAVRMQLATLQRQSHGLIKPLPTGDKRMVDVPLKEVFRHVKLSALKRREQRIISLPDTGFNLFGDSSNPYAIAPDDHLEQVQVVDLTSDAEVEAEAKMAVAAGPRVLKMDEGLRQQFGNTPAVNSAPSASPSSAIKFELSDSGPRAVGAPAASGAVRPSGATPAPAQISKPTGPTLNLKIASLAANWPDEVKREVDAFDPATIVTLPMSDVGTGLSKGKVIFSWAQIRAWTKPFVSGPTAVPENTALQMPLKAVAPAYLTASKQPKAERKAIDMDETIPELFNDGREPEVKTPKWKQEQAAEPEPEAVPETPEETPEPANHHEAAPQAEQAGHGEHAEHVEHAVETNHAHEPQVEAEVEHATEHPTEHAPEHAEEHPPVAVAEAASAPAHHKVSETLGEIFGEPHKKDWTPADIVARAVRLPGVAGAIVALQEGLQVASSLPEGVKSEVVAAFLPQIFARLNQYSGEMKLGDVDDLLFTTHGAHCQIYRLGYIYLAVLGKPGEPLPWHELRLISEELARQTHKS